MIDKMIQIRDIFEYSSQNLENWNKMIKQVQRSKITLFLKDIGFIKLVRDELCFFLDAMHLKNYSVAKQMPKTSQSKEQLKQISEFYRKTLQILSKYLLKCISEVSHNKNILINLGTVGKLYLSFIIIKYKNNHHQWQYKKKTGKNFVPQFLCKSQIKSINLLKISEKLSKSLSKKSKNISIKPVRSISDAKENKIFHNKSNINTSMMKKIRTEIITDKIIKPKSKILFIKSKNQKSQQKSQQSYYSTQKMNRIKNKKPLSNSSQEYKILSKYKLRLKIQDKCKIFDRNQEIREEIKEVSRNILNKYISVVQKSQFQQYLQQVADIYFKICKQKKSKQIKSKLQQKIEYLPKINKSIFSSLYQITSSQEKIYEKIYLRSQKIFKRLRQSRKQVNLRQDLNSIVLIYNQTIKQMMIITKKSHFFVWKISKYFREKYFQLLLTYQIFRTNSTIFIVQLICQKEWEKLFQNFGQNLKQIFLSLQQLINNFPVLAIQQWQFKRVNCIINYYKNSIKNSEKQFRERIAFELNFVNKCRIYQCFLKVSQGYKYIQQIQNEYMQMVENFSTIVICNTLKVDISKLLQKYYILARNSLQNLYQNFYQMHSFFLLSINKKISMTECKIYSHKQDYLVQKNFLWSQYKKMIQIIELFFRRKLLPFNWYEYQLKYQRMLQKTYHIKDSIQYHLKELQTKIKSQQAINIDHCQHLQQRHKKIQDNFKTLISSYNCLIRQLKTKQDILQKQHSILDLYNIFKVYNSTQSILLSEMRERNIICLQKDDTVFEKLIILKQSLFFLQNPLYNQLRSIKCMNIQKFKQLLKFYEQFICRIKTTFIYNLFKYEYQLLRDYHHLAKLILYKGYNQRQLQVINELGLNLVEKNDSLIYLLQKYHSQLKSDHLKKIQNILVECQQNQLSQKSKIQIQQMEINLIATPNNLIRIATVDELCNKLQEICSSFAEAIRCTLKIFQSIWKQLQLCHLAFVKLQDIQEIECHRIKMIQQISSDYNKMIFFWIQHHRQPILQAQFQPFWYIIKDIRICQIEKICLYKIKMFPRLALLPTEVILYSDNWNSSEQITRNIRSLYQEVDKVIIEEQKIMGFVIGIEIIPLGTGIFVKRMQDCNQNSLELFHMLTMKCMQINLAKRQTCQMCLLTWFLWFTKNIEQYLIMQKSLAGLKKELIKATKNLLQNKQLKKRQKQLELTQINMFINHLSTLANVTQVTDYQVLRTIKVYKREKCVSIIQATKQFQYGFQPYKPLVINPSMILSTGVIYQLENRINNFQTTAYVLGQPCYKTNINGIDKLICNSQIIIRVLAKNRYFLNLKSNQSDVEWLNNLQAEFLTLQDNQKPCLLMACCKTQNMQKKHRIINAPNPSSILLIINKFTQYQMKNFHHNISIDMISIIVKNVQRFNLMTLQQQLLMIDKLGDYLSQPRKEIQLQSYLTQIFDNNNLQYRKQKVDEAIKQYISDEYNLIIYGPTSNKTYSIRENHLLNSQNQLTYFYEPRIIPKYKCIVEFQNLSNLDLNSLLNAKLLFQPVFQESQLQQIFYRSFCEQIGKQSQIIVQKTLWSSMILIHQQYMKINYGFYQNMYKIHKNESQSTLNLTHLTHMIHLIIKLFKFQLQKGLYQREQIYTKFCNIVFQIYYYMLSNQLRQKFTIRINQVGLNLRITLKSQNFYVQNSEPGVKIQSIRTNLLRLNSAQLCLTKRYLESGMNVLVHSKDIISLNHFQRLVRNVSKNSTTITLSTQVGCLKGMNGLLIVFDDQHLQDSQLLIKMKRNYEQSKDDLTYLLMIRQNNISSLTRHLLKINLGSISSSSLYQYINKSPLKEQFIQKINQTYLQGELDCYHMKTLLIEMNIELSYKIYNKLYAIKLRSILNNQSNNLKFNLLSQTNFQQTTFLLQTQSKYKIIHNTEIKQFCDSFCKDKSTLISCILQQYLLPLLQYCLLDQLYIIIQQLPIIPYVIASIKQYPIFFVHQKNFILKIILILAQLKDNTNFIVLFPHYIAEKQQFIQFISHFLKRIDFLQMLKLQEIETFWSFQSIRKRYNYSTLFQRNRVLTRMSRSIIKHMKIIISVNTGINLGYPYTKNQNNLAQSELLLTRNFQHKFIKINGCISKEGKTKIINKLVKSYTNEIYLKQIKQLQRDEVKIPVIRLEAVLSKINKIFKEGQSPKKQKYLSFQQYQSRQKLEITANNTRNNIKELELALFRCQKYLQKEIQFLKIFQSSEYQDGNINLNSQLSEIKASFISKSSLNVQNIYKINQEQQFIILELQKILKEAELTNYCQIQKNYIKIKGLKSQIFYKLQQSSSILQNLRSLNTKSFHPNITQIINYLQYCTKVGQMYQHLNVSKIVLEQETRLLQYYYLLDLIYILQNSKAVLQKQRTEQLQLNYYLTFMKQEIDQIEQFNNKSNKFKKIYDIMYLNFAQLSPKNKKIVQIINKNFHQYYDYWIKTSTIYQNRVGLSQLIKFQEVRQSFKLAIYDPFNRFGQFCQKLKGIKILYVRKGQLQIVKQYQFQQTIYCIYTQNFQDLFNRQQQLQQIQNILTLKYKTSSQKKYDKIAVIFTDWKLNNYIAAEFSFISLQFNCVYFQEKLKAQKICQTIKKQFIYQQQQKQTIIWFMKKIQGLNSEQIISWIKSNKLRLKNFRTYFRQVSQCTDMKQSSSIHQKIIKLIENSQFVNQNNILQMIKQRNQQYVLSQLCKKYQYNINKLKNCLKNNLICIIQNQNRDKKRKNVIQDLSKLKKSFKIVEKMHFGKNYRMMSNWLPYKDRVTEDRTHDIIWINQNNISEISISLFHTSSIIWL